jgi:hypothetical protein
VYQIGDVKAESGHFHMPRVTCLGHGRTSASKNWIALRPYHPSAGRVYGPPPVQSFFLADLSGVAERLLW